MKFLFIFSDYETLCEISDAISEVLNQPYCERNQIEREGMLSIHEAYYSEIMQVLSAFVGRYEIKRAVFSEPDENGNVEITWEKIK